MSTEVQVAMIGAITAVCGYICGLIQKTIERYLGQRNFQKRAIVFLREVRETMGEMKYDIDQITSKLESQRSIMKQLLVYSKQQTEAAQSMSDAVKELIDKVEEVDREE